MECESLQRKMENRITTTLQHINPTPYRSNASSKTVEDYGWRPTGSNSRNARKELVEDLNKVKSLSGEDIETLAPLSPAELMKFLKLYVERIGIPWSENFGHYLCEKTFQHFDRNSNQLLDTEEIISMLDEFVFAPRSLSRHCVTVCVFGGGAFGTAVAFVLAKKGNNVKILMLKEEIEHVKSINEAHINTMSFRDIVLPSSITATTDPKVAIENASWIIHAVPVPYSYQFLKDLKDLIPLNVPIISVSKGIWQKSLEFMHEIMPKALDRPQPLAFLSGPSFAKGIMHEDPTAVIVASTYPDLARSVQCLLSTPKFRVYTTNDVVGVEIGAALKNVLAIAAGISMGLGYGANTTTFLVTRGWAEIRHIAVAMGATDRTLSGLSGVGDLMLTCFGGLSRNAEFGKILAKTNDIELALKNAGGVVEGFPTAKAARELGKRRNLELPIISAIADTLEGIISPTEMMGFIMTFTLGPED